MRSLFGILISISLLLAACSVYESQGRKKFESNPSSSFRSQTETQNSNISLNECWVQPASEDIWDASSDFKYTVELLSKDELQVCREEIKVEI